MSKRLKPATWAWVGLVVYITLIDTVLIVAEADGREEYCTMSTAFKTALGHPVRRWQLILSWLLVTLHLFPIVLPEKYRDYEPVGFTGRMISGSYRRAASRRATRKIPGPGSERYC